MPLIIKSNIRKVVKDLQSNKENEEAVTSVADEVEMALERKVENILENAIKRAKENGRKTLQARDL